MAAIWVISVHSLVIPKKEKWAVDIGTRNRVPRFACPNANHCTTASPHTMCVLVLCLFIFGLLWDSEWLCILFYPKQLIYLNIIFLHTCYVF